jgi:hypothetical protein
MVIAVLALFIALGGTSYAVKKLPKNSVSTKQLKNNAVTAKKIKNNAVTAKKIKKGSVDASKVKADSLTGAQINEATVNVGRLDYNSAVTTNPSLVNSTDPVQTPTTGVVGCDPGLKAVGGGVKLEDPTATFSPGTQSIYDEGPRGNDGWQARVLNYDGTFDPATSTFTPITHVFIVYVICAPASTVS